MMDVFSIPKELQGTSLSKYEKEGEIGTGSFGKVCSFRLKSNQWFTPSSRREMPSRIAVKSIMLSESRKLVIRRELGIALQLNHESVTRIVGAEASSDLLHIKMELANTDLSRLKESLNIEQFDTESIRYLAHQVLSGLCYIHKESIVHRDLKPQNILVFWNESDVQNPPSLHSVTLKITDFGLSRFISESSTTTYTVVGTRQYMAPEVARALHKQDFFRGDYKKADVFSAGVVVYEMISDRRPFSEIDLVKEEEVIAPEVEVPFEGEALLKCVIEMLRWKSIDRCEAEYARKQFRTKASSAYMEAKEGWYGVKPLHKAARACDLETAEWLLFSGDDINTEAKNGSTPLHHACGKGHHSMVQMLIDQGADVNRGDKTGWSPLNSASWYGHFPVVKLLIERGADVSGADEDGWTPLSSASARGSRPCIQLLIESGSEVNRADTFGRTPLCYACRHGHFDAALLLIERGAVVRRSDNVGWTPLHFSCGNGHLSLVQLLIDNGADVNSAGSCGWTPLHTSCFFGRLEVASILLQRGADRNIRSSLFQTPFELVRRGRKEEFAQLFARDSP